MTFCLIVLCILILWQMKFAGNGFFDDYLGRTQTGAIKGIFVVLVFMRHFEQYVKLSGSLEKPFLIINHYSGQLIVAMFLFYSGYGILCSIRKKGLPYIKAMPRQKILKLFVRFDLVVLVYLLLQGLLGRHFSLKKAVSVLLGWDSIGNSSWYIFAILFCYIGTWAAFALVWKGFPDEKNGMQKKYLSAVLLTFLFLTVYCLVLARFKTDSPRYYNTVYCYIAGMLYALYKEKTEEWIQRSNVRYYAVILAETILFGVLCILFLKTEIMGIYLVLSAIFSVLVVHITMKLKIGNRPLLILGDYVFEVYILQRLPMIALKHIPALYAHLYLYLLLCILITGALSCGYKKLEDKWL